MEVNNKILTDYCSEEVRELLRNKGFAVGIDGTNIQHSAVPHDLAIKWIRVNYGWHFELVWDIFNGKLKWFNSISRIGDTRPKRKAKPTNCIDLKKFNTPEEATDFALKHVLEKKVKTKKK